MQVGAIFPQTEIGADPLNIREYVKAVEDLGYSHLFIADHVLGGDPRFHTELGGAQYSHKSLVHESLTLMGYIAAITTRLRLATGILILPQRQTALVAKQAAEVDVLSGGRLRLGVGVGWNELEFDALGEDFHNRGLRSEEQIEVMRALWTQETVSYTGRWHHITDAGINPLPVQRPIPVWMGAGGPVAPLPSDRVLRRIARISDGWFPNEFFGSDAPWRDAIARLHGFAREAGRDPASIGMECRVKISGRDTEDWDRQVRAWLDIGATGLTVETRRGGLRSLKEHLDHLERFKEYFTQNVGTIST